jgi:hypothetical protein
MRATLRIIVLGCGLLSLSACASPDSPANVAEDFYTSVNRGDIEGALELVSTESRQRSGDESVRRWLGLIAGLSAPQGKLDVQNSNVTMSDDGMGATVLVTGGYNGDNGNWGAIQLVREESGWKVDMSFPGAWMQEAAEELRKADQWEEP